MIPGPIEVSPEVQAAHQGPPPGHLAPNLVEAFGSSLASMRQIWRARPEDQPFLVAGSGTLAMDMAAANLVQSGDRVLVVGTGYFSQRMAKIFGRYGADVARVDAIPGQAVTLDEIEQALEREQPRVVSITHVDTSTGVRMNAQAVAEKAKRVGALTVVDGVCSTGAEALSMADGTVDVHLTASQKALGLPAGLAFFVASPRAMEARASLSLDPPMYLDFRVWQPIMRAYEDREKAYFATPPTNLVMASQVGLKQIEEDAFNGLRGIEGRVARHQRVASAMDAAWSALGLTHVCDRPQDRGSTLSALRYPKGVGPELVGAIGKEGVTVAGGLHPQMKDAYFRVGHMGWVTMHPPLLERTVRSVAHGLAASGWPVDIEGAVTAFKDRLN